MAEEDIRIESEEGGTVVYLSGSLNQSRVPSLWQQLSEAMGRLDSDRLTLDYGEVSGSDSAGVALVRLVLRECDRRHLECSQRNQPEQIAEFLSYAEERAEGADKEAAVREPGLVPRVGQWVLAMSQTTMDAITFFGVFLRAGGQVLRRPLRLNLREILFQMQKAGADALPIVFFLSGLMGFIIGMQAVTSMSKLGAGIHVADAVTLGTFKEMAPLLTGIIIVGRSGAAFSAALGTMKIKQEIDALEVMGFQPMHMLVLPRVIGLMLAGPLLTMIADASGIFGGILQGYWVLGLNPVEYMAQVGKILKADYLMEGLVKGFAFALMVGLNGCFHGLRTGTAAESVGVQTTTTVVTGIFLIVLLDALLAGLFHYFSL